MNHAQTILVVIGVLLSLSGSAVTIIMQVWVQPKWFREDSRAQAKLITERFDAKLEAVGLLGERASETVGKAAQFFQDAEDRFTTQDNQLQRLKEVVEAQGELVHRVVQDNTELHDRLSTIEGVCRGRHEESIKTLAELRQRSHDEDDDTHGVPRKRGC